MTTRVLAAAQPFSFRESRWYLDRNLDDCMHRVSSGKITRALATTAGPAVIEVSEFGQDIRVEIVKGPAAALEEACGFVTEWLDTDRDIQPFYRLLQSDRRFAPLAEKYHGFHMVGIPDLYECIIWCIAGQQISLTFAYKLKRRLVETYGERTVFNNETYFLFPSAASLAECTVEELRRLQLTTRKCEYIIGLSQAFMRGEIHKQSLLRLGDETEMVKALEQFRGIGAWTANYAVMKSLRAVNRIPYGDAGINQALQEYAAVSSFTKQQTDDVFDRFEGWKSYLTYYLWRSRKDMA